jgi:hypothetical protein
MNIKVVRRSDSYNVSRCPNVLLCKSEDEFAQAGKIENVKTYSKNSRKRAFNNSKHLLTGVLEGSFTNS